MSLGSKMTNNWDSHFEELRRFQKRFGHCRVPRHIPEHRDLAGWAAQQRERYGALSLARFRDLFELGFNFGHHETRWLASFFELLDFKQTHGHCDVSVQQMAVPTSPHRFERNAIIVPISAWIAFGASSKSG